MIYTPGPLPKPDGTAEANKVKCADGWGYEYDEIDAWSRHLVEAYTAAEVARAVAAERERWLRVAEAAQAVTVGCEDQGEDFLLPSHLMSSLALALDESPLAAIRADPQRLQDTP